MMLSTRAVRLLGVVCLSLVVSLRADAASVTYSIDVGNNGTFAHSYIHSATSKKTRVGSDYLYTGGRRLFELTGELVGTLTDNGSGWDFLASSSSALSAKVVGWEWWMGVTTVGDVWELAITGGELLDINDTTGSGASGFLDYTLTNPAASRTFSGTWHFIDSARIPGAPNSLSDTNIALQGNNWRGHRPFDYWGLRGSRALGIDLGGSGTYDQNSGPLPTVPVPGNFLNCLMLMVCPLLLALYRRVRR